MSYAYKIAGKSKVKLKDYDPDYTAGLEKREALQRFLETNTELDAIQEELYAAGQQSVLMILQGMDTSGKDGAIRDVLQNVDPQGCRVESFKAPTADELAHDFLWRVHKVVPARGMLGVFNRSHYEDVVVVRVLQLAPDEVWKPRYEQINVFEATLAQNRTIILKFFLHISREEQARRLLKREQDPSKAWKLSVEDWRNHERWDDYMKAYQEALGRCNSKAAPWYVVPANKKWYRNLAISEALVQTLREYRPAWRQAMERMSEARLAELRAMREQMRRN